MRGYLQLIAVLTLLACFRGSTPSLFRQAQRHRCNLSLLNHEMNRLRITDTLNASPTPSTGKLRRKMLRRRRPTAQHSPIISTADDLQNTAMFATSVRTSRHGGVRGHSEDDGRSSNSFAQGNDQKKDWQKGKKQDEDSILSVVAFNTNWLYIPDRKHDPRIDQLCPWKSPHQAIKHLERIAERINSINAHIFVLSEVHDLCTLESLRKLLDRGREYEAHLVPGTDTCLQMNMGILTRLTPEAPPKRLTRVAPLLLENGLKTRHMVGVPKSIVAKFLLKWRDPKTHVLVEYRIALIGAHLLSGTHRRKAILRRQSQAEIIADSVDEHTRKGYQVIVAGDLNDFSQRTRGKRDHPTNSRVLDTILDAGNGLVNPLELIPPTRRFSNCKETLLDYVLTDSTLVVDSAEIYNHHHCPEYLLGKEALESIFESDHYPVQANINLANQSHIE